MNDVSCLEIMHSLLISLELISRPADKKPWPGFVGILPDVQPESVSLFDVAMPTQGRLHKTLETIGKEGVQIRVTAKSYVKARTQAFAIAIALDKVVQYDVAVGNDRYRIAAVHRSRQPISIGQDDNDRDSFTLDVSFHSKKVS